MSENESSSTPRSPAKVSLTRRLLISAIAAAIIIVIAGGISFALIASTPEVGTVSPEDNVLSVPIFPVQRQEVARQWTGRGTAEALHSADVPTRITATVLDIPEEILPGATVKQSQTLVTLDPADFEQQQIIAEKRIDEITAAIDQLTLEEKRLNERLELAEQDLALSQAELDRLIVLQEQGVANQQDIDNTRRSKIAAERSVLTTQEAIDAVPLRRQSLEAQLASQQANATLAKLNAERAVITSPLAGILQQIDVEQGENLAVGQRVARIVDPSVIEVPIRVRAAALTAIAPGDQVTLKPTGSNPNQSSWTTTVQRIAPEIDAQTRTASVYVVLSRTDKNESNSTAEPPSPGTFLNATITGKAHDPHLVLPARAVRGDRVQIVMDGVVQSRPVEVLFKLNMKQPESGVSDDQWAVVEGNLEPGELVLLNSGSLIPDGRRVEPVFPDQAEASP